MSLMIYLARTVYISTSTGNVNAMEKMVKNFFDEKKIRRKSYCCFFFLSPFIHILWMSEWCLNENISATEFCAWTTEFHEQWTQTKQKGSICLQNLWARELQNTIHTHTHVHTLNERWITRKSSRFAWFGLLHCTRNRLHRKFMFRFEWFSMVSLSLAFSFAPNTQDFKLTTADAMTLNEKVFRQHLLDAACAIMWFASAQFFFLL